MTNAKPKRGRPRKTPTNDDGKIKQLEKLIHGIAPYVLPLVQSNAPQIRNAAKALIDYDVNHIRKSKKGGSEQT